MGLARDLGCSPRRAALVGLAYGLATPAYVYATLAYGHQLSAFALLASFSLLWNRGRGREARSPRRGRLPGGLGRGDRAPGRAGLGHPRALPGGPVPGRQRAGPTRSAFFARRGGDSRRWSCSATTSSRSARPGTWAISITPRRSSPGCTTARIPSGSERPTGACVGPLLWSRYRGLFFYAPILLLASRGWWCLFRRGRFEAGAVSMLGGHRGLPREPQLSGMDRRLVDRSPAARAALAVRHDAGGGGPGETGHRGAWSRWLAILLGLAGAVLMLLFQGVGAGSPTSWTDPLFEVVLPLWRGAELPPWWTGERFEFTLCGDGSRETS